MIKLEEFVNEKLKVTKNSGGVSIKTTLRKFIAWFTGEDEFRVNRFDLEDRNFISSDKSMTKGDITDLLYKHINDTIYVKEEEKLTRTENGLSDMVKSKLYDYSFEIDGITFNIDARIYNDDELLSNCKDYIMEKLKVSAKELVPFEKINIMKFAKALRYSGTIFIKDYTDDLIYDRRYKKLHSTQYNEMYLYSLGLKDPSNPYPTEIEVEYRTKDKNGLRRDYIRDAGYLAVLSKYAEGGDFKSLVEEIYNDIV